MTVHTYHEPVPGMDRAEILSLWAESWRRHGWEPVVHTRAEASAHPQAGSYETRITGLPTVNSRAYEEACWRRWLVAAQVGGFWCDDDLVNVGFTAEEARDGMAQHVWVERFLAWHDGAHPNAGLLLGTRGHYQDFVDRVLSGELLTVDCLNGQPHTSDMYLWHHFWRAGVTHDVRGVMACYGVPAAMNARLIHCSYDATTARGVDRVAAIRGLVRPPKDEFGKQEDRKGNDQ
jgi:hypothetical protein